MRGPTITELDVSNLLSFDATGVKVALSPLTVLIGPNGSGKTNTGRVLETDGRGSTHLPSATWLHDGARPGAAAHVVRTIEWEDGRRIQHRLDLIDANGWLQGNGESATAEGAELTPNEARACAVEAYGHIRWSQGTEINEHQATLMHWEALTDDRARERVLQAAGEADESLEKIDGPGLREALHEQPTIRRVSTGTARAIRRAAEIEGGAGKITILRNPEAGMHPDVVSAIARHIVDASERGQYIVTTYSTMFIDAMGELPESIRVVERDPHRGTRIEPLHLRHVRPLLENEGLGSIWNRGELGGNRW